MQAIKIKVRCNCSKTEIIKKEKDFYKVNVKASAEKGEANKEIIKFFSRYFKSNVSIIKGLRTRQKLLRIE